jgi:hypothetical protein
MERIDELMAMAQPMSSLPILWQPNSASRQKPTNEISIYAGQLSPKCLLECIATIKKAFPALPVEFYDILCDRIEANGFSNERLIDAVNFVIDNCPYPTPTIYNFISYDRKYKFYTYDQIIKYNDEHPGIWNSYRAVKLPDRKNPVFVHSDDIERFKLTPVKS